MKLTKNVLAAAALSLALASGAAQAQDAAGVQVASGTQVYGPQGGLVGTISDVSGDVATLDTGTHRVGLPLDRFGRNAEGQATISVTQVQLNEMAAQSAAEAAGKLDAVLVTGAPVLDANGTALGSVAGVAGDDVTVDTEWGAFVLKKENFTPGEGSVSARVLADQVKDALAAPAEASSS